MLRITVYNLRSWNSIAKWHKIESNSRQQKISISSYTSYRMRINCYGNLRTGFCTSRPTSVFAC